ncbi:MAG: methyltransferase domain-containing protein [Ruminococcaceae bacterium]|nr:methyltransferase domain-containing protein [Oscillospiraceae bacterium]
MSHFCCPVCKRALTEQGNTLRCENGHSFDKARSGYVNLLRSQQSASKRHGDDKRMLTARRVFLDRGFYEPLQRALCKTVADTTPANGVLVDAGCGEGYYTAAIRQISPSLTVCGVDISKDALQMASSRTKAIELAVASVFSLPVADGAADTLVSVFAPTADSEFARVLKTGGVLIRVIPTERHLFGLKAAIYKEPRLNKPERTEIEGFSLIHRQELCYELTLETAEDIRALFEMTPYFYKTGQDDQARVLARRSLCTEIGFAVLTYKKH